MAYGIGIDCGISSVGYCVAELDSNEEPRRIISLGSRIFNAAENPKDGSSLAAPRREKRSQRRVIRRRRHRNERIRHLIVSENLLAKEDLDCLFNGKLTDIYELRTKALDCVVSKSEFARILINLSQRRGFKSNRKIDKSDKENGKILLSVESNVSLMLENGYRTVGEMFFKDEKFRNAKRNKGDNYSSTVSRDMIEDEIHKIFSAQRSFNNSFASEALENSYVNIVLSQRSFDDGPGGESKYGGNQIEKMTGTCTLIPEEKRAAKACYSFQIFSLWQNINNMRIAGDGNIRALTDEERKRVFDLAHSSPSVNYSKIRKELRLADNELFVGLAYDDGGFEKAESRKFEFLKPYHEIRKALDKVSKGHISVLSVEQLDRIGEIFTLCKNDERISCELSQMDLEKAEIDMLMNMQGFSKFGHISVKACKMLIPFLEMGMKYNEACDRAGLNFKGHNKEKSMFLPGYAPELEDINNPVVRRAVSQTIKVINAIVRKQNESPVYINIELAREMSKSFDERRKIEKNNLENRAKNDRIKLRIQEEFGKYDASGLDIVKLKLWEEQGGVCPYSLRTIEIERLFEAGYVDVDHIIPYSISFDDSYNNKVLVMTSENRQKGNNLPLQYLSGKKRDDYIVWVNNNIRNYRKRRIMLKEKLTEEDRAGFKERNLQDTKYLSSFLMNYINDRMEFAPSVNRKRRVISVNGAATAYMRKRWGITKIREDGDLHHAADAAVVACMTQGLINKISRYSNCREIEYLVDEADGASYAVLKHTGEVAGRFPQPWDGFRKELEIRLFSDPQSILSEMVLPNYTSEQQMNVRACFVSRMATRKTKGSAHEDTLRSGKLEGCLVTKTALTELKLDKNGEIEGYYNPASDRLLYEALKKRLTESGGDAKKAFGNETFRKPTSSGEIGPVVKKVKIYKASSLNVSLNEDRAAARNGDMIRIDVFFVEGEGYYFVPIYVADTVKSKLPDKACVANKASAEWKKMKEEDFLFSLYPNDLIKVKSKKPIEMLLNFKDSTLPKTHLVNDEFLYFSNADISTAAIKVISHDNAYFKRGLGVKSLISIEKYEVDALGNIRKAGKEKRNGFGG